MRYQPILEILRADTVESLHHGALAVADADGRLLAHWGDPETVAYLRSSAKPFQALPLVEAGVHRQLDLNSAELALICASHSGTELHAATAAAILSRFGLDAGALQCGIHKPYHTETARQIEAQGRELTPLYHNCSGKHSGMLALAHHLLAPLENYLDLEHPVQQRILVALAEMSGLATSAIQIGIDGCSAPNFALPLNHAATAYARLANPENLPQTRAAACREIFQAMTGNPEMVAGPGRFDSALMQTFPGLLVGKGGAEGLMAVGLRAGWGGPGSPGLGMVLKIADGDLGKRAVSIVTLAALGRLGLIPDALPETLASFASHKLTNFRGLEIGELRPCFQLPNLRSGV